MYLLALPVPVLLDEFTDAVACGYLNPLEARLARTAESPILLAALECANIAQRSHLTPADPALHRAGAALDQVSTAQQVQILDWMLKQRGVSILAAQVVEGAIAIRSGDDGDGQATLGNNAAAGVQMPSPIPKGPWAPPGDQPPPLYIGASVHDAIALHYRSKHAGQSVATNNTPITTILAMFQELGGVAKRDGLSDEDLAKRPDILNLSLNHLYEIKPERARAQAHAKLARYKSIMGKAGIQVELGPTDDPGVNGGLPAPDGTVIFECVEPGVVIYNYRHSPLVPVPVPIPKRSPNRSPKWKWAFEVDLTPDQKAGIVSTTVGGALLLLLLVVLAPVGA